MPFQLEPYIFQLVENQSKLQDWLSPYQWQWGLKTTEGLLTFTTETRGLLGRTKKTVLGEFPVQIIGSESGVTNTWLWAWANPNFGAEGLPTNVLRGINAVREQAQRENAGLFFDAREIPMSEPNFATEMALIATGMMGAFAMFRCPFGPGAAHVALERCPPAEQAPVTAINKINVMTAGISKFSFQHRPAVRAYLGEPAGENEDMMIYGQPGHDSIHVIFDKQGRIADMMTL